ncbi:MAG TPA: hypothetical protein VKA41_03860 [Solirubrobacterales bacterium]|nr:hypothetical protein [Solirubrobacterales bacterium]
MLSKFADPGTVILLAHAGHWLVNLVYLMPVIVVVGAAVVVAIRERRSPERARDEPAKGDDEVPGS